MRPSNSNQIKLIQLKVKTQNMSSHSHPLLFGADIYARENELIHIADHVNEYKALVDKKNYAFIRCSNLLKRRGLPELTSEEIAIICEPANIRLRELNPLLIAAKKELETKKNQIEESKKMDANVVIQCAFNIISELFYEVVDKLKKKRSIGRNVYSLVYELRLANSFSEYLAQSATATGVKREFIAEIQNILTKMITEHPQDEHMIREQLDKVVKNVHIPFEYRVKPFVVTPDAPTSRKTPAHKASTSTAAPVIAPAVADELEPTRRSQRLRTQK